MVADADTEEVLGVSMVGRWRGHPRGRHGNAFPRQDQRFYRTLARLSNDGRGAENNRHLTSQGSSKASPAAQSNTEESVEHTSSERLVVATMLTSEIVPNRRSIGFQGKVCASY
jgi:hypothetical protein